MQKAPYNKDNKNFFKNIAFNACIMLKNEYNNKCKVSYRRVNKGERKMLKEEFEAIANRTVTNEQYKAIEELYMESTLDKYEFVKSIKAMLKAMPEVEKESKIVTVGTNDNSGYHWTPNGCYRHTIKAELIDVDVKTGKYIIKEIPNSYELGYSIDMMQNQATFIG